ncbi:MAG: CpaF family protein [Hyphomicrobiales bacterium]|nr:CpaF family protein [Hyphomicrobiales bacterium]
MFGKRRFPPETPSAEARRKPQSGAFRQSPDSAQSRLSEPETPVYTPTRDFERSDAFYETKKRTFATLIESIDLTALARTPGGTARKEIREVADEILKLGAPPLSGVERDELLEEICNDVLGFGPLEPLLAQDDISDIMINGARECYIESGGRLSQVPVRFADNQELANICQRIANRVGRRVDEATPICDARLPDGSRVNIIFPPLALDGPVLTIRKFRRDRLTLKHLVRFGALSEEARIVLEIISRSRCNVLISGGTGSGKTTLLNCMTGHISPDERIVTCEDAAELQLQQPHVVRLETRPPNLEGEGDVTMRDLVRNCLRMRPERIIVGEVRGPEAFDLLQAMNTGHDGSMSTLHANSPREALNRLEGMILMAGFNLPSRAIRQMITGAIDIVIQVARMRDGKRRVTHITEIVGIEGDVVTTQDLMRFHLVGEDENGQLIGGHRFTGISRPRFVDRARYYGLEQRLTETLSATDPVSPQPQAVHGYG